MKLTFIKKAFIFMFLIFCLGTVTGCIYIPERPENNEGIDLSLTISGSDKVEVGKTVVLNATITIEGISQEVTWQSLNENIAVVSNTGVVTGISKGTTVIVATSVEDSSLVGKFTIKVVDDIIESTNNAPTSIELSANTTGRVGEIIIVDYKVIPVDASQDLLWSSSNEEIATVKGKGIVTLHSAGTVVITCKSNINENISQQITLTSVEKNKIVDYEQQTINMINETKNSILGVANYTLNKNLTFVKKGIGSGFVYKVEKVGNDYYHYLITNKHVIDGSDKLTVYLHFIDEEVDAELLGYDEKVDLALVGFYYNEKIEPLRFNDSDSLQAGQTVIAIGNPEGFEFSSSATAGIVSYPLRYVSDDTDGDGVNDWDAAYIQHDAPINPGNSGGPLLNLYGEVVGINTMKFSATDIDNMGFSIPTQTICELVPYLERGQSPKRATIGIQVIAIRDLLGADLSTSDYNYIIPEGVKYGLYISDVTEGSVAYKGGVLKDDILMEFNGVKLKSSLELRSELNKIIVGSNTKIEIVVLRNNQQVTLNLIF